MAGTNRTSTDHVALLNELHADAPKYDFFQALRLMECAASGNPRIGASTRLSEDPIRLGQLPTLAFAPSSVSELEPGRNGAPPRLLVKFMGMFGPNGPLPLHLTEYASQREIHSKDITFRRFMDIFHHRLLSMFYRSWADSQPTVQFDRPTEDRFSVYVGSMFGLGAPEARDRDQLPDLAKLYYGGRLACQAKNADGLQAMLEDFFQLPTNIDEFVGKWTDIPREFRCVLGRKKQSATLGQCATIGSQVWDCQQKFRITMGPMGWEDYQQLLPQGSGFGRLTALVKNYIGNELMWDVNLVLKKDAIPDAEIGLGTSLGRSVWLAEEHPQADADDLVLTDVRL